MKHLATESVKHFAYPDLFDSCSFAKIAAKPFCHLRPSAEICGEILWNNTDL